MLKMLGCLSLHDGLSAVTVFSAVACLTAVSTTTARAQQTAYSTFGAGDSYNTNALYINSGPIAFEFTSLLTGSVSSYDAALARHQGSAPIILSLYSNKSGTIGTLLDTVTLTDVTSSTPTIYNAMSSSTPVLLAGTSYWFAVQTAYPSVFNWYNANSGTSNEVYSNDGGSTFTTYGPDASPAFRVNLASSAAAAPEPGALALLGLAGLPILGFVKRRR